MTGDWFDRVPKVELHLHLEGAIPLEALWALVRKYGGDPQLSRIEDLRAHFAFRDFPHFIETWVWKNRFLREYEDFTFIAEAVARHLASQGILYVEAFFSPGDFSRVGLTPQELAGAIRNGLDRVPEIEVALVPDLIRDFGPERAAVTLAQVSEVRDLGLIGVGIGGSEQSFPPEPFEAVYAEARRLGFHTSVHAGEAAGPASVWGAIRTLEAERIGHATRAEEDPALIEHLAESQLPLELCPLSNVRTGVTTSLEEHPVRRYFERGLCVTVNTDDPAMFGNSLAEEYRGLVERLGFSRNEIRTLILSGVGASWLAEDRKRAMTRRIESDPVWQEDVNATGTAAGGRA